MLVSYRMNPASLLSALVISAAVLAASCQSMVEPTPGDLSTAFYLKNRSGEKTATFMQGEDIIFHYAITNLQPKHAPFTLPDTGPFASFEVYHDTLLIGTSDDGLGYAAVVVSDTLPADSTIAYEYRWLSTPQHGSLPVGLYTVLATPRLHFNIQVSPSPDSLTFTVTCDSTTTDCDTRPVIISDLPPTDIQLDAFVLNSATVSRNTLTLNVGYSGGCERHDFDLFMSPAAFLESFPVQANLYLRHNGHNDPCDALVTRDISFELAPIAHLYQHFYGTSDTILLNVFDYFVDQPHGVKRVVYDP